MTDDITIDVPTADDGDAFFAAMMHAFGEDGTPALVEHEKMVFEPERCLTARRDGVIVGTAGIFTRRLSVPGASVPAGHVTFVSVAPTARRRGVLSRFIKRQFDDMAAADEPVAVLWASEARIYQRFGYGMAVRKLALTARVRELSLVAGPQTGGGRLVDAPVVDLRPAMVKIFSEVVADRPGWSERAERHWDYRLADGEHNRNGASPLRVIVHEGDGGPDGYALWRVTNEWNENGPNATVRVLECVATNPEAYTQLWRFLLSVDLTRSLSFWAASPDEPLVFLANEVRQLGGRLDDAVWLRVVDLPAALAARRYATEIDVVLEVRDDLIPANAGRWHLTGSPTAASCVATTDPADLSCDIRVIGAAYLGASPLSAQAAGGQVTEVRAGALAAATTAFGWHRSPSVAEAF